MENDGRVIAGNRRISPATSHPRSTEYYGTWISVLQVNTVAVSLFIDRMLIGTCETFITSPAGAVTKYCDEYVCVCVCLSARISPEPHAR